MLCRLGHLRDNGFSVEVDETENLTLFGRDGQSDYMRFEGARQID